jgi:hypothetical protein
VKGVAIDKIASLIEATECAMQAVTGTETSIGNLSIEGA